ncbi:serine hydrolase domain-containing protein [Cohnella panacarvi]|uniref:serine hydrolase domain-containing protein n=1 Tax=Cohnella panacarvi TaxID=400776 RepID=UPI00047D07E7|nr:serine hydrolase [Cohnella panacarvi]
MQHGRTLLSYARNNQSAHKLHKINSVTKSVVSLLIGIAVERGEIASIRQPIADYFPEVRHSDKADVTLEHLLTMAPGWEWPEMGDWGGRPFPMINSMDWVRFIFDRPMTHKPGTRMAYDSGSSHLLSAILQQATGLTTSAYAEQHLFHPLGIERYRWYADSNNIVIGGFGLEVVGPDLAKLGLLALRNGQWNGKQLVPSAWIEATTEPRHHTYDHIGSYASHWWVMTDERRNPVCPRIYFAMGYGGQYIFVVPDLELVVTFASTLYKSTFLPMRLFREMMDV